MNKNKQSRFLGEKKVNGYTLAIYRQPDAREPGCRAFGEVKELVGCVVEGATQKDVLLRAEAAIAEYVKSRENPIKQKPRLVSVKLKPDLYALVLRYAQDQGIESVSTLMRSLVVKKLREDGYDVSTRIAT
jgi:predicted RNase H-like HicB family nuclease